MTRRNKIIYWVATVWLALGMLSTGVVQLIRMDAEIESMTTLGYPVYFLSILGIWKLLGVIAILMPGFALLKEWAYAGFFFAMSGAIVSHLATNNPITETLPPLLLIILTVVSWYFRPADRTLHKPNTEAHA